MKRKWSLLALILLLFFGLVACGGGGEETADEGAADEGAAEEAPAEEAPAEEAPAEEAPAEEVDFVTWYQYDENNEDPASDERVGNQYLRDTIPVFNEEFDGTWNWVNQPKAFDRMATELIAAVQAAGEVPDLIEMGSGTLMDFYNNGTVQDLRPWAEQQSWWSDMDPAGVSACTAPDGSLLCIPIAERPHLVYVWADRFPDGYPDTPEQFLTEAERLKAEGLYAITFFGSTDFDGEGLTRAIWTTIASFGGALDDGNGNMALNTPENVAAIEFLRTIVQEEYLPEIAFAGGFQEEEAFKDASAASFPTGLFGYRYVNPLTAPDGTEFAKGNEEDMLDALEAGQVVLSNFVAPEGMTPSCGIEVQGFYMPVGAENPEGAYAYLNWIMSPEQNPRWVLEPGAGIPVLRATAELEQFQTAFYQQATQVMADSACRPWEGTLERPSEAQALVMDAIYTLIKEDPTADIATVLSETEAEYNAEN